MIEARKLIGAVLLAAMVTGAPAQTAAPSAKPARAKHKTQAQLEQDLADLAAKYDQLAEQMTQMKADAAKQQEQLRTDNKLARAAELAAEESAKQEKLRSESTLETVAKSDAAIASLQTTVEDLKTNTGSLATTITEVQAHAASPSEIPFLGIGLKPGGFLAAETVLRQRGIGGDVNTQFSGIPFAAQSAGRLSEFNASGRQSRVSLLAQGHMPHSTLRGYYEGDFLSAGTTSNDNQSNSYTFRQRQLWAQAELASGWTFTGGQMWSLATEYKSGLTNTKEQIPQTIDAQYTVGFSWERQYAFRIVKAVSNKFWAGFAVEEAQTLNIGGHNLPALVFQQAGNGGGLYNSTANYSFNYSPDLVAKVAYEPGFGHYELFAIGRFFRARAFPNATPILQTTPWGPATQSTAGAFTAKADGGGLGANARIPLLSKRLEVGAHALAGNGMGRYSSSTLPDATAHPDGTLEPLVGGSALGSLEWHATPRFDMYAYYGGEYVKRAFYPTGFFVTKAPVLPTDPPLGQPIIGGYGAPTNIEFGCSIEVLPATSPNGGGDVSGSALGCTADNRNIQEGTLGEWYRFYKGNHGTLQMGLQYSYAARRTWQGVGLAANPTTGTPAISGSPKAIDNMWFTSFRYYLPQ